MAKSLKTRLREIQKLEERAQRDMMKAKQERERLVAPTKGKISGVFGERVDAFLREHLDELVEMRIDRDELGGRFDQLFEEYFFGQKKEQGKKKETISEEPSGEDEFLEDADLYLRDQD